MTIKLIRMLLWGEGDTNSIDSIEIEPYEVEFTRSSDQEDKMLADLGVHESIEEVEVEVKVDEEVDEEVDAEAEAEAEVEAEAEAEAEAEDRYPDYPHSRFDFDLYKHLDDHDFCRTFVLGVYFMYFVAMTGVVSYPLYELVLESYTANTSSIVLYTTSIQTDCSRFLAHLPYIPSFLLGVSYIYPDIIGSLNVDTYPDASLIRMFLWFQFLLQAFTSFGRVFGTLLFEEIVLIL